MRAPAPSIAKLTIYDWIHTCECECAPMKPSSLNSVVYILSSKKWPLYFHAVRRAKIIDFMVIRSKKKTPERSRLVRSPPNKNANARTRTKQQAMKCQHFSVNPAYFDRARVRGDSLYFAYSIYMLITSYEASALSSLSMLSRAEKGRLLTSKKILARLSRTLMITPNEEGLLWDYFQNLFLISSSYSLRRSMPWSHRKVTSFFLKKNEGEKKSWL